MDQGTILTGEEPYFLNQYEMAEMLLDSMYYDLTSRDISQVSNSAGVEFLNISSEQKQQNVFFTGTDPRFLYDNDRAGMFLNSMYCNSTLSDLSQASNSAGVEVLKATSEQQQQEQPLHVKQTVQLHPALISSDRTPLTSSGIEMIQVGEDGHLFDRTSDAALILTGDSNSRPHGSYRWDVYENSFINAVELLRHVPECVDERPYECQICHRRFRLRRYLKTHQIIHSNDRPHNCQICPKRFRWRRDLKAHLLAHSNERPHKCEICQKRFRRRGDLRAHLLVHWNYRPHECEVCQKKFRKRYYLKKHMLAHSYDRPH